MDNLITIEDLIQKVHSIVNYDNTKNKYKNIKDDVNVKLEGFMSIKKQIIMQYFNKISNNDKIEYVDNIDFILTKYISDEIEFFSFLYTIFNAISPDFMKSKNEEKQNKIQFYIQEFITNIKKNNIIKSTPSFVFNKSITNSFKNHIFDNFLIHFMSVYFNINIFVIDDSNNNISFYTSNDKYNKYKKTFILVKLISTNMISMMENNYYSLLIYDNYIELINILIKEYQMIIYNQTNIYKGFVKCDLDDDLIFIDYSNSSNKYLQEEKQKKRLERSQKKQKNKNKDSIIESSDISNKDINKSLKETKEKETKEKEIITDDNSTENIMKNIVICNEDYSNIDLLKSKTYKDLRSIAKKYKIQLSNVINDVRKNKNKNELIDEILKKN